MITIGAVDGSQFLYQPQFMLVGCNVYCTAGAYTYIEAPLYIFIDFEASSAVLLPFALLHSRRPYLPEIAHGSAGRMIVFFQQQYLQAFAAGMVNMKAAQHPGAGND